MSFGDLAAGRPAFRIPRNGQRTVRPAASTYRRPSALERLNQRVTNVGNWFADKTEDIITWLRLITIIPIVILYIQIIIEDYNENGAGSAFISFIGSIIAGYLLWRIASAVLTVLVSIVVYAIRMLFWNVWTLLLAIGVIAGICMNC